MRALDCPLGAVTRLSAGGGALPVIMSIIGPRETHDYRNYNLLGSGIIKSQKKGSQAVALGNFHPLKFLEISNVKFLESSGNFPGKFPVKFHPFWSVEISQRDLLRKFEIFDFGHHVGHYTATSKMTPPGPPHDTRPHPGNTVLAGANPHDMVPGF